MKAESKDTEVEPKDTESESEAVEAEPKDTDAELIKKATEVETIFCVYCT